MRTVHQECETDCGIACVAMLAGVSYEKAKKALFPKSSPRITCSGKLFAALRKLGKRPLGDRMISVKRINLDHLRDNALVGVVVDKRYRHWVVWDASVRKVRDPYKGEHELTVVKYMPVR